MTTDRKSLTKLLCTSSSVWCHHNSHKTREVYWKFRDSIFIIVKNKNSSSARSRTPYISAWISGLRTLFYDKYCKPCSVLSPLSFDSRFRGHPLQWVKLHNWLINTTQTKLRVIENTEGSHNFNFVLLVHFTPYSPLRVRWHFLWHGFFPRDPWERIGQAQ